jgi:hypothetical protein
MQTDVQKFANSLLKQLIPKLRLLPCARKISPCFCKKEFFSTWPKSAGESFYDNYNYCFLSKCAC